MSRSNATPPSTFKSALNTKSEGTEEDTHAPNRHDPTPVLLPIVNDHAPRTTHPTSSSDSQTPSYRPNHSRSSATLIAPDRSVFTP